MLKKYCYLVCSVFLLVSATSVAVASNGSSATDYQPAVISAVAPHYPRDASARRAVGSVVVEVKINAKGDVVEFKTKGGHPLLRKACESAAQRWRFAEAADPKAVRTVDLTFFYSSREDGVPDSQADEYDLITFTLPYRIEVSRYFIVRNSSN
jgi:TonB family protein